MIMHKKGRTCQGSIGNRSFGRLLTEPRQAGKRWHFRVLPGFTAVHPPNADERTARPTHTCLTPTQCDIVIETWGILPKA